MQIILSIRKLLGLDENVVELEKEFTNSVALYPVLLKEYRKEPEWGGCLVAYQKLFSSHENVFFKNDLIKGDTHFHF